MQAPFHGRDDNELYESILSQEVRVPAKVSKECTAFLKGVRRIGAAGHSVTRCSC